MSIYQDTKNEVSAAGVFLRWGIIAIITVAILAALGNALGFISFAFWAPKVEQVRYNTFKQSQSYNEGMIRELQSSRLDYAKATPDQKAALRGILLHDFAVYPTDQLPPELKQFYQQLQGDSQ